MFQLAETLEQLQEEEARMEEAERASLQREAQLEQQVIVEHLSVSKVLRLNLTKPWSDLQLVETRAQLGRLEEELQEQKQTSDQQVGSVHPVFSSGPKHLQLLLCSWFPVWFSSSSSLRSICSSPRRR